MAEFNAAQVLAEAYTLYKKHHDGMGLDFKIAINQVRKESKAEALRDAAEDLFYDGDTDRPMPGYSDLLDRADQMERDE